MPVVLYQFSSYGGGSSWIASLEVGLEHNILEICIQTDCLLFVQGLSNPSVAPSALQTPLLDFLCFCSFLYVKVVKVPRQTVQAAHIMARAPLLSM